MAEYIHKLKMIKMHQKWQIVRPAQKDRLLSLFYSSLLKIAAHLWTIWKKNAAPGTLVSGWKKCSHLLDLIYTFGFATEGRYKCKAENIS